MANAVRVAKWAKGFITNSNKVSTKVHPDTYEDVVKKYEKSGIPIVARDDATDAFGKRVESLMAIYVDVDAIKGKISVDDAVAFAWKASNSDWDGIPWDGSSIDFDAAYDRAMQIV